VRGDEAGCRKGVELRAIGLENRQGVIITDRQGRGGKKRDPKGKYGKRETKMY